MENEHEEFEEATKRLGVVLGDISSDYRSMNESLNRIKLMLYQLYGPMPVREVMIDEPTTTIKPLDQSVHEELEVTLASHDQISAKDVCNSIIAESRCDVMSDDLLIEMDLKIGAAEKSDEETVQTQLTNELILMKEFSGSVAHQVFDEMPRRMAIHEIKFDVPMLSGMVSLGAVANQSIRLHPKFNHDKVYTELHKSILETYVTSVACLELHYFDPGGNGIRLGGSLVSNESELFGEFIEDQYDHKAIHDESEYAKDIKPLLLAKSELTRSFKMLHVLTAQDNMTYCYRRVWCFDPGGGLHTLGDCVLSTNAFKLTKIWQCLLQLSCTKIGIVACLEGYIPATDLYLGRKYKVGLENDEIMLRNEGEDSMSFRSTVMQKLASIKCIDAKLINLINLPGASLYSAGLNSPTLSAYSFEVVVVNSYAEILVIDIGGDKGLMLGKLCGLYLSKFEDPSKLLQANLNVQMQIILASGGGEHFKIFAGSKAIMCYYMHNSKVDHLTSSSKGDFQAAGFQLKSHKYHFIETEYILAHSLLILGFTDMLGKISTNYCSSAKTAVVGLCCELSFESFPLVFVNNNVASFLKKLGVEAFILKEVVCAELVVVEISGSREGIAKLFVFDPGGQSFVFIGQA